MLRRSAALLIRQAASAAVRQEGAGLAAPATAAAAPWPPRLSPAPLPSLAALLPWLNPPRHFSSAPEAAAEALPSPPPPPPPPPRQPPRLASLLTPQTLPSHAIRVEAVYVGAGINVFDLMASPEAAGLYRRLHKGTVVLALRETPGLSEAAEAEGMPLDVPYMAATSYGSAVFFGADASARERWLGVLRRVAKDPSPGERRYTEEYSVAVSPEMATWSALEPECLRLQALDLRNVLVVAQVLAQSVALDFYGAHVERTLETFCSMNLEMAESASIAGVDKQELLRLVAENNIVMTDIVSKLGVHERFDVAWKSVPHGRIWEFLRAELELEPRFEALDMKLTLIQDNLKYFLEILQARKSDSLEWTIIILIAAEIGLSLYELGTRGLGGG